MRRGSAPVAELEELVLLAELHHAGEVDAHALERAGVGGDDALALAVRRIRVAAAVEELCARGAHGWVTGQARAGRV